MNKKVVFIIIGIILLLAGALSYTLLRPVNETQVTQESDSSSETPAAETTAKNNEPGSYVEYSADAILTTPGTKLLFFHAPWCPQCREMEESINTGSIPSGVTVFKVDYDSNQALRQKYGVTLQTTFVKIDDQGNKVASYVAYEEPQFSSVERELLQ